MKHLYKTSLWQGSSGKYYVNDTSDLAGIAGKWWVPARLLSISLTDYILLLKNEYNTTVEHYNAETDELYFYWTCEKDAHKYQLWINKKARDKNYMI